MSSTSRRICSGVSDSKKALRLPSMAELRPLLALDERGDAQRLAHLPHVVHAKDACAALCAEQASRDTAPEPLFGRRVIGGGQKRFATRAEHDETLAPEARERGEQHIGLTR